MAESNVMQVRECGACGTLASTLDTRCQRCQQRGTLRDRYLCLTCERLLDEPSCHACAAAVGIRAGPAIPPAAPEQSPLAWGQRPVNIKENGPPPWLAACVGGAVLGIAIGAIATLFIGGALWVGALVGLVPGALVGVVFGQSAPPPG